MQNWQNHELNQAHRRDLICEAEHRHLVNLASQANQKTGNAAYRAALQKSGWQLKQIGRRLHEQYMLSTRLFRNASAK